MLDNPAGLAFALANLTISNLMAWAWRYYVRSMSPLTINIITYLNQALIQTYNIFISAICMAIVVGSVHAGPNPLFLLLIPLNIFALTCVEFTLIAIALVRLLFVLNYIWMSRQENEILGRKILVVIVLISITVTIGASAAVLTVRSKDQNSARQWFNLIQASIFLLANVFVMVSYLACSFILNRQRAANMAIRIGEQTVVKTRHLLRMRPLFLGNMLVLITATFLLVITTLPTVFQGQKLRPIELQVHVFVMLYYSSQVKLGAFLKQKIVQKLQPFRIWWGRQRQRSVAPFHMHSIEDVAIEMGQLAPRQEEPNIFVISNETIPAGMPNNTSVEEIPAAQAAKTSSTIGGPEILETSFINCNGTEDKGGPDEPIDKLFLEASPQRDVDNQHITCDHPSSGHNISNRGSDGASMNICTKSTKNLLNVKTEQNSLNKKKETDVIICDGNSCKIDIRNGASGADKDNTLESRESGDIQTNGGDSPENQHYYVHNSLITRVALVGEPLKFKDGSVRQKTPTLHIHKPDLECSANNYAAKLSNKRYTSAKKIFMESYDSPLDDIQTFKLEDDLNRPKISRSETASKRFVEEGQITNQTDNIITISSKTCSVVDDWEADNSKFPSKKVAAWFVDEDQNQETASQISLGSFSVKLDKNHCEENQDSDDILSEVRGSVKANDDDKISREKNHNPTKKPEILITKSPSIVLPHVSNLSSLTQLSQPRQGYLAPIASTAWTDNMTDQKNPSKGVRTKITPSSVNPLTSRKLYWRKKLDSTFARESEIVSVIETDKQLYELDDVDEFSQSY
jgi:hypothetical protein